MMDRRVGPAARAGAMAVACATGLMLLASTGQTPTGFVPAAFGGPLGLFDVPAAEGTGDVLSIGDGSVDANELASLLKTVGPSAAPAGPLQASGVGPSAADLALLPPPVEPASAPTSKQSMNLRPVLDNQGRVDCSKAVSCEVDPATNTTTVTFSDGVVAVVQKINDLTLVAYKTLGDVIGDLLPQGLPALPAAVVPTPVIAAAPATAPAVDPTPKLAARPQAKEPSVTAGPVAPTAPAAPDISASDIRPTLTISKPPQDFSPSTTPGGGSDGKIPTTTGGTLDAVKGAVGSVVDAVTDAVKSLGPGAATTEPAKTDATADKPAE